MGGSKFTCSKAFLCFTLLLYCTQITIIATYAAQVTEIKRQLERSGRSVADVAVGTVDSFQGKVR